MSIVLSGSLILTGSISASGNLTTLGTITAQTLVVQTITSSIVNLTGSNIFGSRLTDTQTFTGSVVMTGSLIVNTTGAPELQVNSTGVVLGNLLTDNHSVTGSFRVTGSGTFSSTISAIGESTLFQGVFNDPVPNTVAVLKMSSTPTPSLLSTVVGARMSGSATANFDTYAGYFSNIALSSGNGMSYGIFATASFHTFIGETRFAQGVFNDPINGTAASVKISATPRSGAPTAVFTVGITGAASSGQNTFAGYFTNTSTVSGGGINYGIYATGSNHFFGGNVGIGTISPRIALEAVGTDAASSATSTPNGAIMVSNPTAANSQVMTMGVVNGAGNHSWIQSRNSTSALFYNLALNPVGGNVLIGGTSQLGSTTLSVFGSIAARNSGVDATYAEAFVAYYSANNTESNAILTAVSSAAGQSGFRFEVSNGAGSAARTNVLTLNRNSATFRGSDIRLYDASSNINAGYELLWSSNNGGTDVSFTSIQGLTTSAGNRTGDLLFKTGNAGAPAEKLRLTSGGYLRLASSGIQFQGATAAANALNYYEQGSWTPALQNATVSYSDRSGTYVRIGDYVFVRWGFRISSISGQSGTVTITGLPFTSVSWGSYQEPNISVSTGVLSTADFAQRARVYIGGSSTSLFGRIANNADTTWNTSELQNGSWIIGEIFYNVP